MGIDERTCSFVISKIFIITEIEHENFLLIILKHVFLLILTGVHFPLIFRERNESIGSFLHMPCPWIKPATLYKSLVLCN